MHGETMRHLSSFICTLFNGKLALTQYLAIHFIPNTSTFDIDDFPMEAINDVSAPKKTWDAINTVLNMVLFAVFCKYV